jgi:DNA replication protein DnaC
MNHDELVGALKQLRLSFMAEHYVETAQVAEKKKTTYEQYLSMLTHDELADKHRLKVRRLLKEARLPKLKSLDNYDFKKRKGVTAQSMNRLADGRWIREAGNVVFYGSFGLGKSHLAIALVRRLCERGYRCLWCSTHELIEKMREAKKELTLNSFFKKLDRFDLIACDELGYTAACTEGADLFFQFISQRYERKSLIITTNLTYSEWDKVFINPITTAAAVDRIIHECETINIEGINKNISWRKEVAQEKISKKK